MRRNADWKHVRGCVFLIHYEKLNLSQIKILPPVVFREEKCLGHLKKSNWVGKVDLRKLVIDNASDLYI